MPSITFKAIEYYYLFIQNHYILTLFISSLFARLNQPSRKISEPEHLHGARPQLPTVKGTLYAGQRKLFPHHRPRLRALPELAVPRQPGQHRSRIAARGFFLDYKSSR